jgi:2-polyprenyl-3-methyl-5-hydroxy-6-metoxy-1,4-benzoquinol methylase
MSHAQEVKTHFDQLSSDYKQFFADKKTGKNHEFRTRLNLVAELLTTTSGNLLDCACGTGEITAAVLASGRFQNAVVADISKEMLTFAKNQISETSKNAQIQYEQVDIFKYKPANGMKFDAILCLGLIAHTGALPTLLEHLKSMLAPGGKIILQSSLSEHWGLRVVRFLTEKKYQRVNNYKISYYTSDDIAKGVQAAGLQISDVRHYRFGFPFGDKIFQLGNYWLEVMTEKISTQIGSDAIYVLTIPGK